jgi:hypothetical protein
MGDAAQIVQQTGAVATPVAGGLIASSSAASVAAGGSGLILGMAPALAIPVVGAAIAGLTISIMALINSGCGQSCIITSNWANQAADLLHQNIQAYFSLPTPRSTVDQAAALNNFDLIWSKYTQECAQISGDAGTNAVADRKSVV